jgi:large subunit ribosomal protein L19
MPIIKNISSTQVRELPEFHTGYTVKVHQRIREGGKERVQIFEGVVIARKGGKGVNATFTVRKIASGVGVERIYPLHSPNIVKLEVVKSPDVRQSKIYYVRERQDNTPRSRKEKKPVKAKKAEKKSE